MKNVSHDERQRCEEVGTRTTSRWLQAAGCWLSPSFYYCWARATNTYILLLLIVKKNSKKLVVHCETLRTLLKHARERELSHTLEPVNTLSRRTQYRPAHTSRRPEEWTGKSNKAFRYTQCRTKVQSNSFKIFRKQKSLQPKKRGTRKHEQKHGQCIRITKYGCYVKRELEWAYRRKYLSVSLFLGRPIVFLATKPVAGMLTPVGRSVGRTERSLLCVSIFLLMLDAFRAALHTKYGAYEMQTNYLYMQCLFCRIKHSIVSSEGCRSTRWCTRMARRTTSCVSITECTHRAFLTWRRFHV